MNKKQPETTWNNLQNEQETNWNYLQWARNNLKWQEMTWNGLKQPKASKKQSASKK